ncbi:MAG: response regulator, partial [Pseudomonadota bacterium]
MITQALQLLLIEDKPDDAALVQESLRPAAPDWALHHVETLAAALAFLQQQGVDVVLLDLDLPDSQGLAAVDMIMSRYPAQAVVVLGDSDDIGMSVKAVQQGAQDYLAKGSATPAGMVRAIMYGLERARNRQARRFHQRVVQLLNGSDHLDAMLEGFVDEALTLTGCAAAGVRLLDAQGNIPFVHSKGFPEGFYERECHLNVHRETCLCVDTVTGRCELAPHLHTRRGSLICDDLRALVDGLPAAQRPLLRTGCLDAGFRTELLIPVRAGNQLTGLVQLADPAVRKLPSAWVEILEDTAMQLGLAVARVRATEDLRANEKKLTHLNAVLHSIRKVNALITQQTDLQKMLDGACQALVESRGWQAAWIVALDPQGTPRCWAEQGLGEAFVELQQRFGPDRPPVCWTRSEGEAGVLCLDDSAQSCGDCPVAQRFPGGGAMAARLRTADDDRTRGLLCVSVPAGFAITAEERELFAEVAGDLGYALHTQQLERAGAETQKRLLLEVRRSHQITELAPVVIIALDLQGRLEWVNAAGRDLVGLPEAEIIGRHAFETFVVPRELVHVLGDFAAGMSGDFERIRRYECTVQTGDGREVL